MIRSEYVRSEFFSDVEMAINAERRTIELYLTGECTMDAKACIGISATGHQCVKPEMPTTTTSPTETTPETTSSSTSLSSKHQRQI